MPVNLAHPSSARAKSFPAFNEAGSGFPEANSVGLSWVTVQVMALTAERGGEFRRVGIEPPKPCWPVPGRTPPLSTARNLVRRFLH